MQNVKRKNLYIDENKIKRAQKIFKAKTETETIDRALDLVSFQNEILTSLKKTRAKGHVRLI